VRAWPVLAPLAIAATTVASAILAWPVMYARVNVYDDEGYMLLSLRSYAAGGRLYEDVYSQYGPAFYGLMHALFGGFNLEIGHDTGRLVTLTLLVVTSLLCALLTLRITGRLAVALGVQLMACLTLFALGNEPMHPGGLLCLLLALMGCVPLLLRSRPRLALALIGGLPTLAALVKINVGALALLSTGFAWMTALPAARGRALRVAFSVAIVAAPFVVVGPRLRDPMFRLFALHVASGALALAIVAPVAAPGSSRPGDLPWLGLGVLLAVVVGCGPALVRGTSLAALADGILVRPLAQPGVFSIPYLLPRWAPNVWLLAVLGGLAWRLGPWSRPSESPPWVLATVSPPVTAALRIVSGSALCFTATAPAFGMPALNLAPLAWLSAASPHRPDDDRAAFARWLLPSLATLQVMHAYPVAGSQQSFAALLLVPAGGICVADGLDELQRWLRSTSWGAAWAIDRVVPAVLVAALLGAAAVRFESARAHHRFTFAWGVPLNLPGARWVRASPAQRETYQWITRQIHERCEMFVTLPGLSSLYIFSGQEPPTGLNTTAWMFLLDADEQQRIVDRISRVDSPCAVRHLELLKFWAQGRPLPRGPLLDYIEHDLKPLVAHGGFELLGR
jgi:hypothetical protein